MQRNKIVKTTHLLAAASMLALISGCSTPDGFWSHDDGRMQADHPKVEHDARPAVNRYFQADESVSEGSVSVEGTSIDYHAHAGTLIVHPKGWDDAAEKPGEAKVDAKEGDAPAEAAMFYVAYFKDGASAHNRPITFVFNGGPGSATVWLHMGAFGPRRIVTSDNAHTPAAPYRLVNNDYSLLDASDLVFIDAPGTGFGRIAGKDKEKAFYGVDPDIHAFTQFVTQFLTKYGRWNSPKYLFGESYGTPRCAVLVNAAQTERRRDFNGVILLSQILNYDLVDRPRRAQSERRSALPARAADLCGDGLVSSQAAGQFEADRAADRGSRELRADRLCAGARCGFRRSAPPARRDRREAARLYGPVGRIHQGAISGSTAVNSRRTSQAEDDMTTGRLDTRFSGPTLDPLSKTAEYDPQSAALSSAYVSAFNDYARKVLHYGQDKTYKPSAALYRSWEFRHTPPGEREPLPQSMNVMPDLANAMKQNPNLQVMLNAGYYDLATPFFEGVYEMKHLPIPAKLQANIEYKFYQSGHMVYAHEESLKTLHDNVADFIRRTHPGAGD